MSLTFSQLLMLAGLGIAFGAYFVQLYRKYQAGREMIMAQDPRLYTPDYQSLTKAQRKRLYRIHTWAAVWDATGKRLAAIGAFGGFLFVLSLVIGASHQPNL